MWKHKLILLFFPILAGVSLGVLFYSYMIWNTNIPEEFIHYWFGIENFNTVFTCTISTLGLYAIFLIAGLLNRGINTANKIWISLGIIPVGFVIALTLTLSDSF